MSSLMALHLMIPAGLAGYVAPGIPCLCLENAAL